MQTPSPRATIVEFAFVSRIDPDLPQATLARLVRQAWRHNVGAGLTGEMALVGEEVRQVVEGDVETVLPLASRILSDQRHRCIRVLAFGPIEARRHADWRVTGLAEAAEPPADSGGTVVSFAARSADPAREADIAGSRARRR